MLTEINLEAARALRGVTLVSEVPISDVRAQNGFRLIVNFLHLRFKRDAAAAGRFVHTHRSALAVGLVAATQDLYHGGSIWPRIDEWLVGHGQKRLTPREKDLFRSEFMATLKEYSLPIFGTGDVNNLRDNAALHAGIPNYCLDDWFNLTRRGRERAGDDPADLAQWARVNVESAVMGDIDQPIKRMLPRYPEFAADLFGRAAELTDYLRGNYTPAELAELAAADLAELTAAEHAALSRLRAIGLPPRWLSAGAENIHKHWETSRGNRGRTGNVDRPVVVLRHEAQEVRLVLPSLVGMQAPADWTVRVGDHVSQQRAGLIDLGDQFGTERVTVPIHLPTSAVAIEAGERVLRIPLWREGAPALIFDTSGELVSTTDAIAPGPCWLLRPSDAEVLADDLPLVPVAEDDAPMGWTGWILESHDLRANSTLQLRRNGGEFAFRVQGKAKPQLLRPEAVAGAMYFGDPVLPAVPDLRIPAASGHWQVSVTRYGAEEPVWTATITEPGDHRLMEGIRAPLGTYTVRARGPLGRSLQETFAVAPGLAVHSSPPSRRIGRDGSLQPAEVRVAVGVGITAEAHTFTLTERRDIVLLTNGHGQQMRPAIEPPATSIGVPNADGALVWRSRPVFIDIDWLEGGFPLSVVDPSAGAVELVATVEDQMVQRIRGTRRRGTTTFQLAQLRDTAAHHGSLNLHLSDGQPVGVISEQPRFQGIAMDPQTGAVSLEQLSGRPEDLEAWVWLKDAPWRFPVQVAIEPGGELDIPEDLVDMGDLLVHVRRADPWVPAAAPDRSADKTLVAAPGSVRYGESERTVLRVAAGDASVPLGQAELALALQVAESPGRVLDRAAVARLHDALARHAPSLVHMLLDAAEDETELMGRLIDLGLHRSALISADTRLWERSPELAAGLNGRALLGAEPVEGERLAAMVTTSIGESYWQCLALGADPLAAQGVFDQQAIALEAMPPQQMADVLRHLSLVPGALLDADTRSQNSADIMLARMTLRGLDNRNLPQWARNLGRELASSSRPDLAADLRKLAPAPLAEPRHWIPTYVRAVALVSRMEAHELLPGGSRAAVHDRALGAMGRRFPRLVLSELARAEALVVAPMGDAAVETGVHPRQDWPGAPPRQ